ncbi:hypothetical protein H4S02_010241 [Coemansia sp. RSA 2611]|nr:hypothetical protein H4S02_010241 [Coemansia sp. RSA 2611]
MALELGSKRRRADEEPAGLLPDSDGARLVRSKRMRGADGRLWEAVLPTPPTVEAYGQVASHRMDAEWSPAPNMHQYGSGGSLATPAHSPPHGASAEPEDESYEDELDPASQYYAINRLLNQLHHERAQRRHRRTGS